jgi:hypothetical protein
VIPPSYSDLIQLCTDLVDELHGYKVAHPDHDEILINKAREAIAKAEDHVIKTHKSS